MLTAVVGLDTRVHTTMVHTYYHSDLMLVFQPTDKKEKRCLGDNIETWIVMFQIKILLLHGITYNYCSTQDSTDYFVNVERVVYLKKSFISVSMPTL